jgi:hypothetical protein
MLNLPRKTLRMKKIFYLVLVAVTLFSCQKKETDPADTEQEVTFNAAEINPENGLKSTEADYDCIASLTPDYARIDIEKEGVVVGTYYPKVFRLGGKLYTQAIKLPPGTYTVTQFLVMDDMGTPDDLNGDQIYMAIPETGSNFAAYTEPDIPFPFTVSDFIKTEVSIELLCFQPENFDLFGFNWFAPTEIVIREKCFFGDICVNPDDYIGSMYDADQLPAGCQVDMPALMEIVVTKDGVEVPYSPFTNATAEANYGVGAPLCVQYPDNLNEEEVFTFAIYVLVKTSQNTFAYQLYQSFQVNDDQLILPDGGDGIVDFAIGDCSPDADFIWEWLDPPLK